MSSLLHGYHHIFCVASGTPTASIFSRALKCSEYWHSMTFLRVQLRLCHYCEYRILDLRKRPSSRYHLAQDIGPVRLYQQNVIAMEISLGVPNTVIWPQVKHWTRWHLCWHLSPWHKDWKGSGNVRTNKQVNNCDSFARRHFTYPQPLKLNKYSVHKYNDCREGMWTLHLSIFLFSHESDHDSSQRLPESDLLISAAGLDTGISDGESTGAEESGPIAEECWPVLLLKSQMDQISQVDTGHSGFRNEMRYIFSLRLS